MKSNIKNRQIAELGEWLKSVKLALALAMGYAARWRGYNPVYTVRINQKQQITHELKEVDMTEFKCDTRNRMNFLYRRKQPVFTVLYRLYNYC
jgi:hypothetical protein